MTKVKFKSLQPLIPSLDVDKGITFYQETLGFKLAWKDGSPATFAIVYRGDVEIFLTTNSNPEHAQVASIRIEVENIEALYLEYNAKNIIHPNGQLTTKPWGLKEFVVLDLNGVCIAFHEMPKTQMKEAISPNKELQTERLVLLPLRSNHYQQMHEIYSDPTAMVHWHTLPHSLFSETESLLNEYLATNSSWVIKLKDSDKIIGLVNCFSVEDSKSTGMGYILSPEFQRKGLAKEASQKVIEHLFKVWNVSYVELWIYDDNTPSIYFAQKLGFKLENTFERSAPRETSLKKTGIYWLRQSDWWIKNS